MHRALPLGSPGLGELKPPVLALADERFEALMRGFVAGRLGAVEWETVEPRAEAVLAVATPPPWSFLVVFCAQRARTIRPLVVLKNAVPLYELAAAPQPGALSRDGWAALRAAVLQRNPGLEGALRICEGRSPRDA